MVPPRLGDGISVCDGLLVLFDVMQFLGVRWKHWRSPDRMVNTIRLSLFINCFFGDV